MAAGGFPQVAWEPNYGLDELKNAKKKRGKRLFSTYCSLY